MKFYWIYIDEDKEEKKAFSDMNFRFLLIIKICITPVPKEDTWSAYFVKPMNFYLFHLLSHIYYTFKCWNFILELYSSSFSIVRYGKGRLYLLLLLTSVVSITFQRCIALPQQFQYHIHTIQFSFWINLIRLYLFHFMLVASRCPIMTLPRMSQHQLLKFLGIRPWSDLSRLWM